MLHARWQAPPHVHALTTTRDEPGLSRPPFDRFNLGLRSGDDIAAVIANRGLLQDWLRLPAPPHWLKQVHGTGVLRVGAPGGGAGYHDLEDGPEADAAVTSVPGVVLAILTADCLPVVFCDRAGTEIGAAHAGWRGLAGGVLEATVAAMRAAPGELLAWIGPGAGPARYEIGAEVRNAFVAQDAGAASAFVETRTGHWLVDLPALARRRLVTAGMNDASVTGGDACTLGDATRFFSHRRDARTGRMATLAWMDPPPAAS